MSHHYPYGVLRLFSLDHLNGQDSKHRPKHQGFWCWNVYFCLLDNIFYPDQAIHEGCPIVVQLIEFTMLMNQNHLQILGTTHEEILWISFTSVLVSSSYVAPVNWVRCFPASLLSKVAHAPNSQFFFLECASFRSVRCHVPHKCITNGMYVSCDMKQVLIPIFFSLSVGLA